VSATVILIINIFQTIFIVMVKSLSDKEDDDGFDKFLKKAKSVKEVLES